MIDFPLYQAMCSMKLEGFTILLLSLKKELILIHWASFPVQYHQRKLGNKKTIIYVQQIMMRIISVSSFTISKGVSNTFVPSFYLVVIYPYKSAPNHFSY